MMTDNYIICGLILLICLTAIIFGLRILKETRKMDPNAKPAKTENKGTSRKKLQ